MKISCRLLAIGILYLVPLASVAQEVVPYANSDVKVDWVRGTDFSKYKTYAWGAPNQKAPGPNHPLDDIDAALQAEGLQKVGITALAEFPSGETWNLAVCHRIYPFQTRRRSFSPPFPSYVIGFPTHS